MFSRKYQRSALAASLRPRCTVMSLLHSAWIDHVLVDRDHLEYGGLLEGVSFLTLIAWIALAGLSVAAVTLLYAL